MQTSTRVNASMLGTYQGRSVSLVGKILSTTGSTATLLSDGQQVNLIFSNAETLNKDSIYELRGEVNETCDLNVSSFTQYNEDFDLDLYNEMINEARKSEFSETFGF